MKLNIGILGCANIAFRSFIPAIVESGLFNLCYVASRTEDKAKEFADKFNCKYVIGYDNLVNISELDAIYIPLPTGLHEEWVLKCLNNGKHVICEKSLGLDYHSVERMVNTAKNNNLVIMENFMFKYHRQHEAALKIIKEELGEIRLVRSSFGFPPLDTNNFRYNKNLGGGALLDAGAYTIKATQLLLGNDLEIMSSHLVFDTKNNIDLYGSAEILEKNNNVISQIAFGFDNFYQCHYEVWGSQGKLTAKRAFTPPADFSPEILVETNRGNRIVKIEPDNHFINILREFYNKILHNNHDMEELLLQSKLISNIRAKNT